MHKMCNFQYIRWNPAKNSVRILVLRQGIDTDWENGIRTEPFPDAFSGRRNNKMAFSIGFLVVIPGENTILQMDTGKRKC